MYENNDDDDIVHVLLAWLIGEHVDETEEEKKLSGTRARLISR